MSHLTSLITASSASTIGAGFVDSSTSGCSVEFEGEGGRATMEGLTGSHGSPSAPSSDPESARESSTPEPRHSSVPVCMLVPVLQLPAVLVLPGPLLNPAKLGEAPEPGPATTALQRLSPLSALPFRRMARTLTLIPSPSDSMCRSRGTAKFEEASVKTLALSGGGEEGRGLLRG